MVGRSLQLISNKKDKLQLYEPSRPKAKAGIRGYRVKNFLLYYFKVVNAVSKKPIVQNVNICCFNKK